MPGGDRTTYRPRAGDIPLCPSDISPASGGNLDAGVRLPSLRGGNGAAKGGHVQTAMPGGDRTTYRPRIGHIPPLSFGHFPRERGKPSCQRPVALARGGNGAAKGGAFKRRCLEVITRPAVRASVIPPFVLRTFPP